MDDIDLFLCSFASSTKPFTWADSQSSINFLLPVDLCPINITDDPGLYKSLWYKSSESIDIPLNL